MRKGLFFITILILLLATLTACGKANPAISTGSGSESKSDEPVAAENSVEEGQTVISKTDDYTVYETDFVRDEKRIYGNLYLPNTGAQKYPIIVLSHGYEGSYSGMAAYAEIFAQNGFAAYVFDFCGGSYSSKSDGKTTEMSVLTEEADLTAVLNGLSSLDTIDPGRLFIMGESQGGMVSALTAADNQGRIRAMVLLYPALVIPDNARKQYSSADQVPDTMDLMGMTVGKIYYTDVLQMNVYQEIKSYAGNVLILHGDEDTLVPISYSERAVKEYPSASLTVIHGGGHGFYGSQLTEAANDALDFFNNNLS